VRFAPPLNLSTRCPVAGRRESPGGSGRWTQAVGPLTARATAGGWSATGVWAGCGWSTRPASSPPRRAASDRWRRPVGVLHGLLADRPGPRWD